ncbi:MAG: type II secretion system F family protein [Spirochaetaceae bacterium]|nr:type II secretion system F family protein [Spirochaetaceae bacterium]
MAPLVAYGAIFAAGVLLLAVSGPLSRSERDRKPRVRGVRLPFASLLARAGALFAVQAVGVVIGAAVGWQLTGLVGVAVLFGGLGVLLPPFVTAPVRRRRATRVATAWSLWTRQLAELARSGVGMTQGLRATVPHAPAEIAGTIASVAAVAEAEGVLEALDRLARSGTYWEPEVAAGLRMAATSGGSVADPLLDLASRISDVVQMHRTNTEAVVQMWTQTIALLVLALAIMMFMYRNNPSYFEPYQTPTGQLVLAGIAAILLASISFLVHHSVLRTGRSVLVPPRRPGRVREPL